MGRVLEAFSTRLGSVLETFGLLGGVSVGSRGRRKRTKVTFGEGYIRTRPSSRTQNTLEEKKTKKKQHQVSCHLQRRALR